jgi:hypothetical protein
VSAISRPTKKRASSRKAGLKSARKLDPKAALKSACRSLNLKLDRRPRRKAAHPPEKNL